MESKKPKTEGNRAAVFWAEVAKVEQEVPSALLGQKFFVECNNELLRNRKYNGYISLLGRYLAFDELLGERWVPKRELFEIYRSVTGFAKNTTYRKINETIDALEWVVTREGNKDLIDTSIDRFKNRGTKKINGYITLSAVEVISLLKTKSSAAVKLYLRLKQLNNLVKDEGNLRMRMVTITGERGLAASLGYAENNRRSITKALETLKDCGLLEYTGNQFRENMNGKYILINAIMGDKKHRWVSYNATPFSNNYLEGLLNIKLGEKLNNGQFSYGELTEIEVNDRETEDLLDVSNEDLSMFVPAPLYIQECEMGILHHSAEANLEYESLDDNFKKLLDVKYG